MNSITHSKQQIATIFFALCFLYGIVTINLFFIQIYNYSFYAQLAQQQYNVTLKQTPPRALIYDRNNKPLAVNQECFSAFVMPHKVKDKKKIYSIFKSNNE